MIYTKKGDAHIGLHPILQDFVHQTLISLLVILVIIVHSFLMTNWFFYIIVNVTNCLGTGLISKITLCLNVWGMNRTNYVQWFILTTIFYQKCILHCVNNLITRTGPYSKHIMYATFYGWCRGIWFLLHVCKG